MNALIKWYTLSDTDMHRLNSRTIPIVSGEISQSGKQTSFSKNLNIGAFCSSDFGIFEDL